jgi:superfamily II DNA or RNA helicase
MWRSAPRAEKGAGGIPPHRIRPGCMGVGQRLGGTVKRPHDPAVALRNEAGHLADRAKELAREGRGAEAAELLKAADSLQRRAMTLLRENTRIPAAVGPRRRGRPAKAAAPPKTAPRAARPRKLALRPANRAAVSGRKKAKGRAARARKAPTAAARAQAQRVAQKAERARVAQRAERARVAQAKADLLERARAQREADRARKAAEKEEAERQVLRYQTRPAKVPVANANPPLSVTDWVGDPDSLFAHQRDAVCASLSSNERVTVYQFGMGSGKTRTAIAAAMQFGSAVGIVPATLKAQWQREIRRWGADPRRFEIVSYDEFYHRPIDLTGHFAFVDEAQALRSTASKRARVIFNELRKAKKVALLSGTPLYNSPTDLSVLLNPFRARGEPKLPVTGEAYDDEFGGDPDAFARLVENNVVYFQGGADPAKYPSVVERTVHVIATPQQQELYRALEERNLDELRKLDSMLAGKLADLTTRQEQSVGALVRKLTAFATQARQIPNRDDRTGPQGVPKIAYILKYLKAHPRHRVLVFSTFLESGLDQLVAALRAHKISHEAYTGEVRSLQQRNAIVERYNAGKTRVLLLSSAGGEGLDLKRTDAVFVLEPHWNWAKIRQAIGRAARYESHPPNSTVRVFQFVTAFPGASMRGIEQAMVRLANDKQKRIDDVNHHIVRRAHEVAERRRARCAPRREVSALAAPSSVVRHTGPAAPGPDYRSALRRARR